VIEKFMIFSR